MAVLTGEKPYCKTFSAHCAFQWLQSEFMYALLMIQLGKRTSVLLLLFHYLKNNGNEFSYFLTFYYLIISKPFSNIQTDEKPYVCAECKMLFLKLRV